MKTIFNKFLVLRQLAFIGDASPRVKAFTHQGKTKNLSHQGRHKCSRPVHSTENESFAPSHDH